ncbi:hypothetical protein Tco_1376914, partial [Tanacetum coccineum]
MQTQMNNLATSNQRLESMLGNFIKMNTASTSGTGSLPSNTVANPKGELKAITTRSGLVLDEPSVPMPPPFINPEEDERVEETFTDPEHGESFTIKVPTSSIQKATKKFCDSSKGSSVLQTNQQVNTVTPSCETCGGPHSYNDCPGTVGQNQNVYAVGAYNQRGNSYQPQGNHNLLSYRSDNYLGPPRDVFVPVGKFTFPADFVIVDYESDPQMILRDGNERLILNMRNDTSSYSNEPHQEPINMIDVYNVSHEEIHEDLFATNHPSGNPTSLVSTHANLTSPEVNDDIFDMEEDIIENLLNLDKTKHLPPYNQSSGNLTPISELETKSSFSSPTLISLEERNSNPSYLLPPFHNSLSGSTTSSSPSLHISETSDYFLEEFADELAHITFPPGNDDLPFDAESDLLELEYLLNHDPIKDIDSILKDSVDENSLNDNLDDTISEMLTDEHALDYSSPPLWDDYDDNLFDHETVNDDTYDDPFDFKEKKIKDSKLLIDELDLPE